MLLFLVCFGGVGGLMLGLGMQDIRLRTSGTQTVGTVTAIHVCQDNSDDSGGTLRLPAYSSATLTVSFTDAGGRSHAADTHFCTGTQYAVADSVTIVYLPNDPSTIEVADQVENNPFVFTQAALGAVFLLLPILAIAVLLFGLLRWRTRSEPFVSPASKIPTGLPADLPPEIMRYQSQLPDMGRRE
jgi:hypothetical protein